MHFYLNSNALTHAIEKKYGARYIGYWELKSSSMDFCFPSYYFYQSNPDTELGHSEYFKIRVLQDNTMSISDGSEIMAASINGLHYGPTNEVIISQYRHDFSKFNDHTSQAFIDGGCEYLRFGFGEEDGYKLFPIYIKDGLLYNQETDELIEYKEFE